MLQLCNAPRGPRENLLMAGTDQQQIRQYCYTKGFLDPSLLPTHLVCAQSQVSLEFPIDLLYGPPALICTYHLSRDPLVQIGHQDFRMFRADVSPFFTQHHSDVADVPQAQACTIHPEGFAAFRAREAGHPDALRIDARQMRHQVFDRFILDGFPGPGNGKHKTPAPSGISRIALQDHLHMLLVAIGGIALDDDPFGPRGRDKALYHGTKQRIFRLISWMAFRSDQTKGHWQAIHVPVGNQQDKAHPEKPGLMLAFPSFLGQWVLCAPLGLVTAVPHEIHGAILGWGKVFRASWTHHSTSRWIS